MSADRVYQRQSDEVIYFHKMAFDAANRALHHFQQMTCNAASLPLAPGVVNRAFQDLIEACDKYDQSKGIVGFTGVFQHISYCNCPQCVQQLSEDIKASLSTQSSTKSSTMSS